MRMLDGEKSFRLEIRHFEPSLRESAIIYVLLKYARLPAPSKHFGDYGFKVTKMLL